MLKLFRANIIRITKSKTFWICSAVYLLYNLLISRNAYQIGLSANNIWELYNSENPCFANFGYSASPITGLIILAFVSIFVGEEIRNNAIRNKIVIGYSKSKIYLSNLFACIICMTALNLVYLILSIITMPNGTFTLMRFIWVFFNNVLTISLYISIYTLMIMNTKNTVLTLIVGSGLAFCLWMLTQFHIHGVLTKENSYYSLIALAFYPTGYDNLIAIGFINDFKVYLPFYHTHLDTFKPFYFLFPFISVCMTVLTAGIGSVIFKKSNLK